MPIINLAYNYKQLLYWMRQNSVNRSRPMSKIA